MTDGETPATGLIPVEPAQGPVLGYRYPFELREDGLYYYEEVGTGKKETVIVDRKLCSPLVVTHLLRDEKGKGWGRRVEFADRDGRTKSALLWMTNANGDFKEWCSALHDLGLEMSFEPKDKRHIADFIREAYDAASATVANNVGWTQALSAFVLPSGAAVGALHEPIFLVPKGAHEPIDEIGKAGTLEQWQSNVAAPCRGNSRAILALCAAFAGPLLSPLGRPNPAFNFFGASSTGKTTVLRVAASVHGDPAAWIQSWNATETALEQLLARRNNTLVVMDEIGEASERLLAAAPYLFSDGKGRLRSDRGLSLRESTTWRVVLLSTGEVSLDQAIMRKNRNMDAGQAVRFIDVPAQAHPELGLFETLNGHSSARDLAKALGLSAERFYGTAGPHFVERLIDEPLADIVALAQGEIDRHLAALCPGDAGGQVRRVAEAFALLAFAGELACMSEILPFEAEEIGIAISTCFKAWLDHRGTVGELEPEMIVERVRLFCQLHGSSRFAGWDDDDGKPQIKDRVGYVRHGEKDKAGFYIFPEAFKKEVCRGLHPPRVVQVLFDRNLLRRGPDGPSVSEHVPAVGSTMRMYHLSFEILGEKQPHASDADVEPSTIRSRAIDRLKKARTGSANWATDADGAAGSDDQPEDAT